MPTLFPRCCLALLLSLPGKAEGFAAWFVDRKVSCMTDLIPDEIIMNNGILPHSSSREPGAHLDVSPLVGKKKDGDAASSSSSSYYGPNSEIVVKFVVPPLALSTTMVDAQFVLEISGHASSGSIAPAKFTSSPPGGGIGCDGRRSHGKLSSSSSGGGGGGGGGGEGDAIFTIDSDATLGSMVKIVGGWATGHEAVTLTEQVVIFVGQGVATNEVKSDDDALLDDVAMAELEEAYIEEEREDIVDEIEAAEEDAIEALEERREEVDPDGLTSHFDEAEEEIVGVLEVEREDVNQALDSLKEEIISKQAEDRKEKHDGGKDAHTAAQRREAQQLHRIHHERKNMMEDKMQEMRRRFKGENDARRDKLDQVMDLRGALKDSVNKLKRMDKKEHDHARREHIKPLGRENMKDLIKKAKEKFQAGVDEMMHDRPAVHGGGGGGGGASGRTKIRGGGDAGYHGDVGTPLHPVAKTVIQSIFALALLCGLVDWYLGHRRKAAKGRRNL